jgi:putative FmdB family regulatory protein
MPIYEYACTACGERTEARQTFDDPPLQECAKCGGGLRKLYSPVGVVFKGSGFYSTDARKSGDKSSKSASKSESADSKSESPSKKSDTSSSSTESNKEKSA